MSTEQVYFRLLLVSALANLLDGRPRIVGRTKVVHEVCHDPTDNQGAQQLRGSEGME